MPHDRRIARSLALAAALLVLAAGSARAGAGPEDDVLGHMRGLVEGAVLRAGAQPGEQARALAEVRRLARGPAVAEEVLPLCQQVIRSRSLGDRGAALAAAECLAACLAETRLPVVDIRDRLMAEVPRAGTASARAALLEVAERFYSFLERPARCEGPRLPKQTASAPAPVALNFDGLGIGSKEGKLAARVSPQTLLLPGPPASAASPSESLALSVTLRAARAPQVGDSGSAMPLARTSDAIALALTLRVARPAAAPPPAAGLSAQHPEAITLAPALRAARPQALPPPAGGEPAAWAPDATAAAASPHAARVRDLRVRAADERAGPASLDKALAAAIEAAAKAALDAMVSGALANADQKARDGDRQAAVDILAALLRDTPDTASSAQALSRALGIFMTGAEAGERANRLAAFGLWATANGGPRDGAQARLLILQELYGNGDFKAARDGLGEFLKEHGASDLGPRAELLLGLTAWKLDDRPGAVKVLRELVHNHPGHPVAPQALFLVGYLSFSAGEAEAAQAAFLRVIRDYPDSAFAEKAIDFLGGEAAKRAEAQAEKPAWRTIPTCSCTRVHTPPTVDGRIDEAEWQGAAPLKLVYRDDAGKETPDGDASVRIAWDATHLYVAVECKDGDIRSEAKARDDPVLVWDALRVLIAPVAGGKEASTPPQEGAYYEFALSPNGVLNDGKVEYSRGVVLWQNVKAAAAWNSPGVRYATKVNGTLNDNAPDKGWTAELAIPFADLGGSPTAGATWRLNVLRVAGAADKERAVSAWSPSGGWLPQPREFGRVTFASADQK
ncbi:MAG TPA: tetratricopeptide repeat protein [Phycisphaerae bacterium]|nr:tetratricopeptide repeat protein [Phycisphaerae bacterium]